MDTDKTMTAELQRLCAPRPELSGALLAGVDGLLVASDLSDPRLSTTDTYHLAALAAASVGLGHQYTNTLQGGPLRECVVRSSAGCVVTYPAGDNALLILLTKPTTDLDKLRGEAQATAQRAGELFEAYRHQPQWRYQSHLGDRDQLL